MPVTTLAQVGKTDDLLSQILGDIDRDGIEEKIVVSNTDSITDMGLVRNISIYKSLEGRWELWISSSNALLCSEGGGIMGDPFEGIKIIDDVLVIHHFGGSRWKWSLTDKYKVVNNALRLIAHRSYYGTLCAYWQEIKLDFVTGIGKYNKEVDKCEHMELGDETSETDSIEIKVGLIPIQHRYINQSKILFSDQEIEIYY